MLSYFRLLILAASPVVLCECSISQQSSPDRDEEKKTPAVKPEPVAADHGEEKKKRNGCGT